jgi:hypothetical protein
LGYLYVSSANRAFSSLSAADGPLTED